MAIPNNPPKIARGNLGTLPVLQYGELAFTQDTGQLWAGQESGVNRLVGGPGSSANLIGTFDGNTPGANGITIVAATGTLYMQSASASMPGLVNTGTQTFAGNKTFLGTVTGAFAGGTIDGTVIGGTTPAAGTFTTLSGALQYKNPATGAVARAVQAWLGDRTISAKDFGAAGDGVTDDTAAIQSAITAASVLTYGATVFIPAGSYVLSGTVTLPVNVGLRGAGFLASALKFSHTGDCIASVQAINSSTAVRNYLSEIAVVSTNASSTGACIRNTGGSFMYIDRCYIEGALYGVVFDQAEICAITNSNFALQHRANIWLVNGSDESVGANQSYTNQILVQGCQLNISATSGHFNVIDDGGLNHIFISNNFFGGYNNFRGAGISELTLLNNTLESAASNPVYLTNTSYNSSTAVGAVSVGSIKNNSITGSGSAYAMFFDELYNTEVTNNGVTQVATSVFGFGSTKIANCAFSGNGKLLFSAFRLAAPFFDTTLTSSMLNVNQLEQAAQTYVSASQTSGAHTVTPATMEGIAVGDSLYCVNLDDSNAEYVTVTAVTGTTFTATFAASKAANWVVFGAQKTNGPIQATGNISTPGNISAQNGTFTGNVTASGTAQVGGTVGVGLAPSTSQGLVMTAALSGATSQYGLNIGPSPSSGATNIVAAIRTAITLASGSYTCANYASYDDVGATIPTGVTVTTYYGMFLGAPTVNGSIGTRYGIYQADSAATNRFAGTVQMAGSSSGAVTVQTQAAAGTYNFNLPTTAGAAGTVLTSQGGGSTAMTWTTPLTNPMTGAGDGITGGTSGAVTRMAAGTSGQVVMSNGAAASSFATVPGNTTILKAPTIQKFTSGSGTYTLPTSPSPIVIRVRMVGGGGGGVGSGTAAGTAPGAGGNTTFGTTLLVANGGGASTWNAPTPAAGGTASLGTGPIGIAIAGGMSAGISAAVNGQGDCGAAGPFGGQGGGGNNGGAGFAAAPNSGSGGGGAGGATSAQGMTGGAAGGFVDAIITSPAATYAYAVGAAGSAGTAGTSGQAGGAGGSGLIEVTEYYQ